MILLFTATSLFACAAVLFCIQPFVGKLLLPLYGGSPYVWSTCIIFFQLALLVGYGYAHFLKRWLKPRAQFWFHLAALLIIIIVFLPFKPPVIESAQAWIETPFLSLFMQLVTTYGLPTALLFATSPLLQHWFGLTTHAKAQDPYFLFAASNLGSLLGLLAYPLWLEGAFTLATQNQLFYGWIIGLGVVLFLTPSLTLPRAAAGGGKHEEAPSPCAQRMGEGWGGGIFSWFLLAFVPSALMLSATTLITTNIAPLPLFWVIPLMIYLITFIMAFLRPEAQPNKIQWLGFSISLICLSALSLLQNAGLDWWHVVTVLAALFFACWQAHSLLSHLRPPKQALTEYYWWVALGGAAGSIFAGFFAIFWFETVIEYFVLLLFAALLFIFHLKTTKHTLVSILLLAAIATVLANSNLLWGWAFFCIGWGFWQLKDIKIQPVYVILAFTGLVATTLVIRESTLPTSTILATQRDFFGVKTVLQSPKGQWRTLKHGIISHGSQNLKNPKEPTTYYSKIGPFGDVYDFFAAKNTARIAVLGLGTGTIAAYQRAEQHIDFYEIDTGIVAMAKQYFTYLNRCGEHCAIIMGDARLSLQAQPISLKYDLIIIDTFSGDAIPMHLMTQEALAIYQQHLQDDGAILFHISNHYLDFLPVLKGFTEKLDGSKWQLAYKQHVVFGKTMGARSSQYACLSKNQDKMAALKSLSWKTVRREDDIQSILWTDQKSSLFELFH